MYAHATKPAGLPLFASVGHFFASLGAAFAGAQQASRLYRQLSRLSDSQLAARGLTRADVSRLTLEALDSRFAS